MPVQAAADGEGTLAGIAHEVMPLHKHVMTVRGEDACAGGDELMFSAWHAVGRQKSESSEPQLSSHLVRHLHLRPSFTHVRSCLRLISLVPLVPCVEPLDDNRPVTPRVLNRLPSQTFVVRSVTAATAHRYAAQSLSR